MPTVIAARQGRRADAQRIAEWLAGSRQPYAWSAPLHWRAAIAAELGASDVALMLLDQAVAGGRLREFIHTDPALVSLREHPRYRALMQPRP